MYVWIWRHLPGGVPAKVVGSLALLAAVVVLLFFVVFPWVGPRLPFNNVTVAPASTPSTVPSAAPAATPN